MPNQTLSQLKSIDQRLAALAALEKAGPHDSLEVCLRTVVEGDDPDIPVKQVHTIQTSHIKALVELIRTDLLDARASALAEAERELAALQSFLAAETASK